MSPLVAAFAAALVLRGGAPEEPARMAPPKHLTDIPALKAPPIVIRVRSIADWDLPPTPPVPDLTFEPVVTKPVLEDLPYEIVAADASLLSPDIPAVMPAELFLGRDLEPATLFQATWVAGEAMHGATIPTPVLIANGKEQGQTICLTAAVHGDEINGIEAVRRVLYAVRPEKLRGRIIGVPIVNLQGFQRHSRYVSDRRDLNRSFPGNRHGSVASRMAFSFFNDIIRHCDDLVDLHTGSFHRTNLPQLRADLSDERILRLTRGFGSTVILHSSGGEGTLRRAAVEAGIPAVTLEAGEPLRLDEDAVEHTVKAIFTLLDTLDMYDKRSLWGNPEPTYYNSLWVRADQGGILLSAVKLGRLVKAGDALGTVTNPITNKRVQIDAPYDGRVIGMALNQFVMPGYAVFHLATEGEVEEVTEDHMETAGLNIDTMELMGATDSE